MKESAAIKKVIAYERRKRRNAKDFSKKKLGYDVSSSGRLIEVKGRDFPKHRYVFLTKKEFEMFLTSKNMWLYVVTNSGKIIEIGRNKVLAGATQYTQWHISLRKNIIK